MKIVKMILASENQVTGFQRIVRYINSGQKFWERRTARDFVALNVANIKPQEPYTELSIGIL